MGMEPYSDCNSRNLKHWSRGVGGEQHTRRRYSWLIVEKDIITNSSLKRLFEKSMQGVNICHAVDTPGTLFLILMSSFSNCTTHTRTRTTARTHTHVNIPERLSHNILLAKRTHHTQAIIYLRSMFQLLYKQWWSIIPCKLIWNKTMHTSRGFSLI